jgi:hypothetical protein
MILEYYWKFYGLKETFEYHEKSLKKLLKSAKNH